MLFTELGLSEEILKAVTDMGFEEATDIQSKAIPLMLEGRDVIGKSNTGTGKTAAFGLPTIQNIKKENRNVQALVLCPTRELALQACDEIRKFASYMPWVKPCAVFGGASMDKQIMSLKKGANIVVGTPGRVMDHINRRTLKLENLRTIILDEADEMLNMGFREDIEEILQFVPEERQTVLFSATMPPAILAITDKYQNDPEIIKVENKQKTALNIEQFWYEVPMGRKTDALRLLITAYEPKLSMIFCNTKHMVDELTEALTVHGFKVAGLHGDMKQQTRLQVLNSFKSGRINILIATDVAARGIDVDDIDAVFNYDIPQDIEYYIHRIGRTGRAGKSGKAYTLVSGRRQVYDLKDIARYTKAQITQMELPEKEEVESKKISAVTDEIRSFIESTENITDNDYIKQLMDEGFSAESIANALLLMRLKNELANIPEFRRAAPKSDGRNGRINMARLVFSIGRRQRIAPNFIIAALAETTGIPGKSFGKIDIYDEFTTVDVPESEKEYIIDLMDGQKINGCKVSVRIYEGKPKDSGRKGDRGRDDRQRDFRRGGHNGHDSHSRNFGGKKGGDRNSYRGKNSRSGRQSKIRT